MQNEPSTPPGALAGPVSGSSKQPANPHEVDQVPSLASRLWIWLLVGSLSFGGRPLNLLYNEMVTRRGWLRREDYAEAFALGKLLPGDTGINAMLLAAPLIKYPIHPAICLVPYLGPGLVGALTLAVLLDAGYRAHWVDDALRGVGAASVGIVASIGFDVLPAARSAKLWLVFATASFVAIALAGFELAAVLAVLGGTSLIANRPGQERP